MEAVLLVNSEGKIVKFNKKFEEICGYTIEELKGESMYSLIDIKDLKYIQSKHVSQGILRTDKPSPLTHRICKKSGKIVWIKIFPYLLSENDYIAVCKQINPVFGKLFRIFEFIKYHIYNTYKKLSKNIRRK